MNLYLLEQNNILKLGSAAAAAKPLLQESSALRHFLLLPRPVFMLTNVDGRLPPNTHRFKDLFI